MLRRSALGGRGIDLARLSRYACASISPLEEDPIRDSALYRVLKRCLSPEDLDALCSVVEETSPEAYDSAVEAAFRAMSELEPSVARNQERAERHCQPDTPIRRLRMLADNSPPPMLVAIARRAFQDSYGERFDNRPRSLELAEIGLQAALLLRESDYLDVESQADLESEAWVFLANAKRINSDMGGAERAFASAEECLAMGTSDRVLRARLLHEKAALRFSQGRGEETAELYDQEIKLRRLLGESDALGRALINRGVVAAWTETIPVACQLLFEGASLVNDHGCLLLALNPLAERLARDGDGLLALKVLHQEETVSALVGSESHQLRLRWVRGIAYRVLGQLPEAEKELRAVRRQLAQDGPRFRVGIASLDLAAVCVAEGKIAEVKELAEEAFAIFRAEGLDRRALAALVVFRQSAAAEELTEALAVRVANFITAHQYNRDLRFESAKGES